MKKKLLTMKVTSEEKSRWSNVAKSKNITLSSLIRTTLDGEKPRRELPQVDPNLIREIVKIGNNINQIARALNSSKKIEALIYLKKIEANLELIIDAHKIH